LCKVTYNKACYILFNTFIECKKYSACKCIVLNADVIVLNLKNRIA
jgi:hypothetical protein